MQIGLLFVIMGIMMGSWRTGPSSPWSTWYGWRNIWEDMTVFMKFTTLTAWLAVFLFFLIETKMVFRIDIFPNIDTPIDKVYNDLEHDLNDWYRNL
jgi:hypothetical protein